MKKLTCEMCGSTDLMKDDGVFVCQSCGMKYSVEEAKKMMIEGTVDVQGTVKVDNSVAVEKYLINARRALEKEDWGEIEKYYNLVEQNYPNNIEAVFFSAYGKTMSLFMRALDGEIRTEMSAQCMTLRKSISVISDYYEETTEDKEQALEKIGHAITRIYTLSDELVSSKSTMTVKYRVSEWLQHELNSVRDAYIAELKQIDAKHHEIYLTTLMESVRNNEFASGGGCYIATAVYGSYDCPEVWTLRRYRDNVLAETWYGRAFIRTYYAISPTVVKWFGQTNWFKQMWKGTLDRKVRNLNGEGFANTPYEDKKW